jgi:PST family polysaccharide transporter
MARDTSHGVILRSTGIVALSAVAGVAIGLVRSKVLAALLGPAGVGLAGILGSVMSTASTLAGAGLSGSAVRQLAASGGDAATLARVRRALWTATLALGVAGGLALWLLRDWIAMLALADAARGRDVGWLGLGVFLSVVAGSQTALLQGLRRVGDMARATVAGAALGALAGTAAIWTWGEQGVLAFVLLAPAMSVACATYYARRLESPPAAAGGLGELAREWRALLSLGMAFMLVTLVTGVAQVWVRAAIVRDLGLPAAGHFQAAWAISTQYVGIVLGAMVADYYPRLTREIGEPARVDQLVNEQIEMGLLLAAPALLAMLGLAPWLVRLLYSDQFGDTVEVLRWQVAGDILKVASWPIGFVLVARGERLAFLGTQSLWAALYVGLVLAGLSRWGIEVTGIAFLACFAVGFLVNCLVVGKLSGFRVTAGNLRRLGALLAAAGVIAALARVNEGAAAVAAVALAAAATVHGVRELARLLEPGSRAQRWFAGLPGFLRGGRR